MSTEAASATTPRPWLWAALFVIAMSSVTAARISELVGPPWTTGLALLAMTLMVPMVAAARRKAEDKGCSSPALRTYSNRGLIAGGLYMVTFLIAANVYDVARPPSAVIWLLALIPVVPLLGMIWAMVRYVADETDEYLRHRAMMGALIGLAGVLVLGTVWGFLETFGLVPHVWSWWVFPAWAIGMALGQLWMKARGA